jgi:hypothetical protein
MRWGITKQQADTHETVLRCARGISDAQVFVGYLGSRYGWTRKKGDPNDAFQRNLERCGQEFPWIVEEDKNQDRSVTHIEWAAAMQPDSEIYVGPHFVQIDLNGIQNNRVLVLPSPYLHVSGPQVRRKNASDPSGCLFFGER